MDTFEYPSHQLQQNCLFFFSFFHLGVSSGRLKTVVRLICVQKYYINFFCPHSSSFPLLMQICSRIKQCLCPRKNKEGDEDEDEDGTIFSDENWILSEILGWINLALRKSCKVVDDLNSKRRHRRHHQSLTNFVRTRVNFPRFRGKVWRS